MAPLLQVAQQTTSEFHVGDQLAAHANQSFLSFLYPHLACHRMEDTSFPRRRLELGTGLIGQLYQFSFAARITEAERIGNHLEERSAPLRVFPFCLLEFLLLSA